MTVTQTITIPNLGEALEAERARLVRLCAFWLGDAASAEDAAQETLIEAWRHYDQLREAEAFRGWLTGIARNVCARWGRRRGREQVRIIEVADETAWELLPAEGDTLTIELEREELAALLDRALALLPEESRMVLIQKYLEETPHDEIAARLGLSANATAVRLHRGRLALRTILATEMARESATLGVALPDAEWQQTPIWCTGCGQERLLGKWNEREFVLRCPRCSVEPGAVHTQTSTGVILAGVRQFRPALKRFSAWMDGYYRPATETGTLLCRVCQRPTPLRDGFPPNTPPSYRERRGLHALCDHCGGASYESLEGLALNLPQGQRFFREYPRIQTLPEVEIDYGGSPALVVRFASVTHRARYHVIVAREGYRVLDVPGVEHE